MIYFISGSSKIKKLNSKMKKCLDNIINDKDAEVIVGDCYGVDILAQNYLKEKGFEKVVVYCSTPEPKRTVYPNFISMWNKAQGLEGEEFYQVKDKEMCNLCDKAVAFWNGKSYGVKCNIERIKEMNKPLEIILSEFDIPHTKAERELNLENNLTDFGIL